MVRLLLHLDGRLFFGLHLQENAAKISKVPGASHNVNPAWPVLFCESVKSPTSNNFVKLEAYKVISHSFLLHCTYYLVFYSTKPIVHLEWALKAYFCAVQTFFVRKMTHLSGVASKPVQPQTEIRRWNRWAIFVIFWKSIAILTPFVCFYSYWKGPRC